MIFDSLKNSALYYPVSPRLEKAFGFIASTDWETMEPGIHELDGKDIYVNVMEPELKKPADAKLEIHDAYIDIQVLIRGEQETFGWSERADLRKPLGEFDAGKDIRFFDDEPHRGVGVAGGAGDKDNPRSRSSGDCVVMCRKSIIFRCRSSAARR